MTPFALARSETRLLSASDGRARRLFIAAPLQPPPPAGYPVIYALDGNAIFATLVEAVRMRSHRPSATGVAPALVVGLGYDSEGPYDRTAREHDYAAGAVSFLAEIEDGVKPAVARDYPVDASRQILYGHSLAGLFVLRTLASRPECFRSYVAVSPSIWREREELSGRIAGLAHLSLPLDVMIAVGEYEQVLAPWQTSVAEVESIAERRASRSMVDDARAVAQRIAAVGGPKVRVQFDEVAGEDHASVVLVAITRALRFVLAPLYQTITK